MMCSTRHASLLSTSAILLPLSPGTQMVSRHPWHLRLRLVSFPYQTGHKTILRMSISIILLASLERNEAMHVSRYMHCDSDIGRKERSYVAITNTSLSIRANSVLAPTLLVTLPAYILITFCVMDAFLSRTHYSRERKERSCAATSN